MGTLDSVQTTAGLLVALAVSIAGLWVVVSKPGWVDRHQFRQARSLATLVIAVGLVLVFVFWGNLENLPKLSRVAIVGIPVCLVAFLINVAVQLIGARRTSGVTVVLVYLTSLIAYIVAGSIALSASAVMLMVWAKTQGDEAKSQADNGRVLVSAYITGQRIVERIGEPIPFRVSSGQVNFGCDQRSEVEARFQLPAGATISDGPQAEWQGFANVRDKSSTILRSGQEIVARGMIVGLPAVRLDLPFGGRVENCPGGGHGELVLAGAYTGSQQAEAPFETTLSSELQDSSTTLQLPSAHDIRLARATVQFSANNNAIPNAEAVVLPLNAPEPGATEAANGLFKVRRLGNQLEVSRRE